MRRYPLPEGVSILLKPFGNLSLAWISERHVRSASARRARREGRGGYRARARVVSRGRNTCSSESEGTTMQSPPSFQFAGVATEWFAVSFMRVGSDETRSEEQEFVRARIAFGHGSQRLRGLGAPSGKVSVILPSSFMSLTENLTADGGPLGGCMRKTQESRNLERVNDAEHLVKVAPGRRRVEDLRAARMQSAASLQNPPSLAFLQFQKLSLL
jgi:hypothetical protein